VKRARKKYSDKWLRLADRVWQRTLSQRWCSWLTRSP